MNPSFKKAMDGIAGRFGPGQSIHQPAGPAWIRRDRLSSCAVMAILLALTGIGRAVAGQSKPPAIIDAHTLMDETGRHIHFNRPFTRIISLYGAHTENLFALGLRTEIIGVSSNEDYPPEALQKKVFTYHDDAEKFLAAAPDLVLARPMIERGYPGLISRLEQSGITVVSLQPATVKEMFVYWRILGQLTGKQAQAERMIASFTQAIDSFRSLSAGVLNKKRVYLEAIHDKMKTFTPDAMAAFVLKVAGGINAAADAEQVRTTNIAFYGKERILAKGRSIDVYLAQRGAMNRPSVAMIQHEPGFEVIKAVQDNQIYIIDEMIISRPTLRLLAGVYAIGRILYPQRFDAAGPQILLRSGVAIKEAEH